MSHRDKLSYIILGLLKTEPLSGYDLKKSLKVKSVNFGKPTQGKFILHLEYY